MSTVRDIFGLQESKMQLLWWAGKMYPDRGRSECTRCVVFFSLASLSKCPGRLATHGWNFVWHALCDGGMLHSLPMINLQ